MAQRPVSSVPLPVMAMLVFCLAAQIGWRSQQGLPLARAQDLPPVPAAESYRLTGLGDPLPLAQATAMWLQAFDNQPGVSVPYRELDFERAVGWLDLILELDPKAQAPLLVASHIYGEVPDPHRQRIMLDFVARQFEIDPINRWPWMAHVTIVAKHKLKDDELALRFARRLRHFGEQHPEQVPAWARQMEIVVLTDMGQEEAAKVLIGGLLQSGRIKDETELRLLSQRLEPPGNPSTHPGNPPASK